MEYIRLGRTNLEVSRLGLGAMAFGSRRWRDWILEEAEAKPIIDRALDLGINFFDTSDCYSGGEREAVLGRCLFSRVLLDDAAPIAEAMMAGAHWIAGSATEGRTALLAHEWVERVQGEGRLPHVPCLFVLSGEDSVTSGRRGERSDTTG